MAKKIKTKKGSPVIKEPAARSKKYFPVVGVGASAGGIEAFRLFIKGLPETPNMAFILIQHLHPEFESNLKTVFQKDSRLPVWEITDNIKLKPNNIYVIPSNKLVLAEDGVLKLSPRPPKNELNRPIDIFFESLAEVHQSNAIGIVLSGLGTDGTLGLKKIKDHGGITFAQEIVSAAYDSMPHHAINASVVDFIMPPEEMPKQLMKLQDTLKNISPDTDLGSPAAQDEEYFKQVLALLRVRRGVDFTFYKQSTIRRRILRRMLINKIERLAEYVEQLRSNKVEQDILYQDLLIPVTSFFRDPAIFDHLCDSVLPSLLENKSMLNPLRIWVAGCSTGEEAYSIAICLHEYLGDKIAAVKIQIFATDISEKAIVRARTGLYSKKELENVSEQRLQQFFQKTDGYYQLKRTVRDLCVFANHNFLKDPPFAHIDLLSCRNVQIYMDAYLQKKALGVFHYALNDNGLLLLGKSETVGNNPRLFNIVSKTHRLYSKNQVTGRFISFDVERSSRITKERQVKEDTDKSRNDFQRNADEVLLAQYIPAGVIINEQFDIVQFRGATGDFLEAAPGKASLNIFKMTREGLAFEIRNALHKAKQTSEPVIKENILIKNGSQLVSIEVVPLLKTIDLFYLILFRYVNEQVTGIEKIPAKPGKQTGTQDKQRIKQLEKDLAQLREDMRSITEDQEAANEELQSANEELLSGSEELQSLNEEMETSKEELQSSNEELMTINQELFERSEQYNQARLYAETILKTIHEPFIILNKELRIKTSNQSFQKIFFLSEDEIAGKIIFELQNRAWDIPELRLPLLRIQTAEIRSFEYEVTFPFHSLGEKVFNVNIQLIESPLSEPLILMAFEDITLSKKEMDYLKQTAAQQKAFAEELEVQVLERTDLLNETNKKLTHSNRNLGQFASIASHDLQEPLRKIQTFTNLLRQKHKTGMSEQAAALIEKINKSSDRMSSLVKDILRYSKLENPAEAFEQTDLDLIFKTVMLDLEHLIKEKKADVRYSKLPEIYAIPLQIGQLFYNLLINALKFSKNNESPLIDISWTTVSKEELEKYPGLEVAGREYIKIIFKDNGTGFDPKFSEQIFLIFQRLHEGEQYAGTGIGLALCQNIVFTHHGFIWAESDVNKGASFYIILPLK